MTIMEEFKEIVSFIQEYRKKTGAFAPQPLTISDEEVPLERLLTELRNKRRLKKRVACVSWGLALFLAPVFMIVAQRWPRSLFASISGILAFLSFAAAITFSGDLFITRKEEAIYIDLWQALHELREDESREHGV